MAENEEYLVEIQKLVYEGTGLARLPDGKAVFVPYVLPTELARIRIIEEKAHFAHSELLSIEQQSPLRIRAECAHFGICGGCHYQHLAYEQQLIFKHEIFVDQLERIGKTQPEKNITILPSPTEWAYRNTVQFQLNTDGKLCFNDRRNQLFAVSECHLPMPAINRLWPMVEFGKKTGIGRVEIRQSPTGELLINLETRSGATPEIETEMPISIVHLQDNKALVLAGSEYLEFGMAEKKFRVHCSSFFQTNFGAAEQMVVKVQEIVTQVGCGKIIDAYCGCGLFSAFLADAAESIVGIEESSTACEDFAYNLNTHDNIALYQGKTEKILSALAFEPDCIILDPPRAGLKKEVTQAILKLKPALVIYASCNPATLARDCQHLIKGGYTLEESILVDMFPQTYHIESINIFRLK